VAATVLLEAKVVVLKPVPDVVLAEFDPEVVAPPAEVAAVLDVMTSTLRPQATRTNAAAATPRGRRRSMPRW
jgi:hypothetical protein